MANGNEEGLGLDAETFGIGGSDLQEGVSEPASLVNPPLQVQPESGFLRSLGILGAGLGDLGAIKRTGRDPKALENRLRQQIRREALNQRLAVQSKRLQLEGKRIEQAQSNADRTFGIAQRNEFRTIRKDAWLKPDFGKSDWAPLLKSNTVSQGFVDAQIEASKQQAAIARQSATLDIIRLEGVKEDDLKDLGLRTLMERAKIARETEQRVRIQRTINKGKRDVAKLNQTTNKLLAELELGAARGTNTSGENKLLTRLRKFEGKNLNVGQAAVQELMADLQSGRINRQEFLEELSSFRDQDIFSRAMEFTSSLGRGGKGTTDKLPQKAKPGARGVERREKERQRNAIRRRNTAIEKSADNVTRIIINKIKQDGRPITEVIRELIEDVEAAQERGVITRFNMKLVRDRFPTSFALALDAHNKKQRQIDLEKEGEELARTSPNPVLSR
jgi:hypothetical protein